MHGSVDVEKEYEALLQFLYLAPIGVMQTRLDGEITMLNPLCSQLLMPLSRDGDMSNLFVALEPLAPDLREQVRNFEAPHGKVCDGLQLQWRASRSGREETQYLSLTLLKLDPERMMAVLADVTHAVLRERALRHSQAWLDTIATGIVDFALMSLDAEGRIQSWNPGVERLTGHGSAATLGQSPLLFYPPGAATQERMLDRLHEADRNGWSLDEGWRQRADGSRYWGSCLIAPLHAPDEPASEHAYSLILRDISHQRDAREAWLQTIARDHLTGLANRRAFYEAAELEMLRWTRAPRPLSIVMVDADHFKAVNDRYGHPAGDAVLRHLAACLEATFRAADVVARIGGEEFVVLLPGTGLEGAELVAERLCRHVAAHPAITASGPVACTVSAGVATMEAGLDGLEELLRRADAALYAAKSRGRNRVATWCGDLPLAPAAAA